MILLIDNYDSFTYNIYQYLACLGAKVKVVRNDAIDLEAIRVMKPEALVLSPGPGHPSEAGITIAAIKTFAGKVPILGICLGHQAIGQAFGGKVTRAEKQMHGKISVIQHQGRGLFKGLPKSFEVTRYHSLVVESESLPPALEVTATTSDGTIMGLRHRKWLVEGVQFHPESYKTEHGMQMLANFIAAAQKQRQKA